MKKTFCKQDVVDIGNCDTVKISARGYFFDKIPKDSVVPKNKDVFEIKVIDSLTKKCFGYVPLWGAGNKAVFFPYFLPACLVFEKPEARPFKSFKECFRKIDCLADDEDIDVYGELGIRFDYRIKGQNELRTELVTSLRVQKDDDGKETRYLNDWSLDSWFRNTELLINGDWVCFGVEE